MKTTCLIFFLICSTLLSFSQDIIFLNNGSEIKAKVLEIENEIIKYRNFEQLDGPLRSLPKKDIFLILYQDGTREKFTEAIEQNSSKNKNNKEKQASFNSVSPNSSIQENNNPKIENRHHSKYKNDYKNSAFLGVGSTVGGAPGIGYERVIIPKTSIILAVSYIGQTIDEKFGYGLGVRYSFVNIKSYLELIYGTGSHYETGGTLGFSKNYLQGVSFLFGYKIYLMQHFSLDLELGGRYVLEEMHTSFTPISYALGINLSYNF